MDPVTIIATVAQDAARGAGADSLPSQCHWDRPSSWWYGCIFSPPTPYPPYWGEITANIDWCEPNYQHTQYVAESWNTLTAVFMFFPHALGLWQSWKCGHSWNVLFSWFLLVNLAIATIAFHGTLKRWGQMYDESIMFMSQAQMLNCLMICKQISGKKRAAFCITLLTGLLVLYSFVDHVAFLVMYGLTATVLLCVTLKMNTAIPTFRNDCLMAMIGSLAVCWFPDRLFCEYELFGGITVQYFGLHGWFHIIALMGQYYLMLWIAIESDPREELRLGFKLNSRFLLYLMDESEAQEFREEESLRHVPSPKGRRNSGMLTIIQAKGGKVLKRKNTISYDRRCILIKGRPSPPNSPGLTPSDSQNVSDLSSNAEMDNSDVDSETQRDTNFIFGSSSSLGKLWGGSRTPSQESLKKEK